jgi:hypothetical protein
VKTSPYIERWFDEIKPPRETMMRRVREIILRAEPRLTESIKYGTLTFAYEGDLAAFVQIKKKQVSLMFNRGARIPGQFPHLEGTGATARFMRFDDLDEVEARAAELGAIAAAWCAMQASASPEARPGKKPSHPSGVKSTAKRVTPARAPKPS